MVVTVAVQHSKANFRTQAGRMLIGVSAVRVLLPQRRCPGRM